MDGRDPNIQQEYFDAEQGEVSDHLDSNFGIINFRAEKAMFNLSGRILQSFNLGNQSIKNRRLLFLKF